MKLTKDYINSLAPNQNAVQNAQSLVKKNNFVSLSKTEDEGILFGECLGSGSDNYRVSVDFIKSESPVFRCTCPSRQIPCKHVLGLMYAFTEGKEFTVEEIPSEIIELREKAEKKVARQEQRKNAPESTEPKKVNLAALKKKIQVQLQGIDLLEKMLDHMIRSGVGTLDAKSLQIFNEQAKQLGDAYLPGVQNLWLEILWEFEQEDSLENRYTGALPLILQVYALIRKGREYLTKKLANPLNIDVETPIEELLGHAWQLTELRDSGRVERDVELVQLSFNSCMIEARREFVDTGIWLNLQSGIIQKTRNHRPFKATAHIREDDTFFQIIRLKELFVYPGEFNPRIRWEEFSSREITSTDLRKIKSRAAESYAETVKIIKNQLKNPLADKNPIRLLSFTNLGIVNGLLVMENSSGERLVLTDIAGSPEPPSTQLLSLLQKSNLGEAAILIRFEHNFSHQTLQAHPLSITTDTGITRLAY